MDLDEKSMPTQHKIYNFKYSYCIFFRFTASQLNETKNDALSIIGKVGEKEKNINISLSLKSESFPLVISILGMSTSNPSITLSVRAETKEQGLILISPLEITVDRPVYIGCFSSFTSSDFSPDHYDTSSHLDCLVYCKNQFKNFVLLQENKCYCHSKDTYSKLFIYGLLVSSAQCNITCETDSNSYCGGVDSFSVYVAGNH